MSNLFKRVLSLIIIPFVLTVVGNAIVIDGVEYWAYDIPVQYSFEECPTYEEVQNMSMYSSCGLTFEQFESALLGDLKEYAWDYYDAQGKYGVNAVLKAAQDALESDWGRACFSTNNISGFFTEQEFTSKSDCIDFTASRLQLWYLLPPEDCDCGRDDCTFGQFYKGDSVYEVSIKYCPIDGKSVNYVYGDKVSEIAYGIYKRAFQYNNE